MVHEVQEELEESLPGHVADCISSLLDLQNVLPVFLVQSLEVEQRSHCRNLLGSNKDDKTLNAEVLKRLGLLSSLILEVHDQVVRVFILFRDEVVELVNLHNFAGISLINVQILLLLNA